MLIALFGQALQAELTQHKSAIQETLTSIQALSREKLYPPAEPIQRETMTLLSRCSDALSHISDIKQQGGAALQTTHKYTADMQVCLTAVRYCHSLPLFLLIDLFGF